jgi:hypothetical protein
MRLGILYHWSEFWGAAFVNLALNLGLLW